MANISADFLIDAAELAKAGDQIVRRHLDAGTRTVATITRRLEHKLEDATQAAVPGDLWKAWASKAYPRSGPAKNPAGTIFLKGRDRADGALAFWTQPGEVRGRRGQWLAIPTPAAGSRGRGRNLTPGEWELAHRAKLRFVYRPGRPGLLVADGGTTIRPDGTATSFRLLTRGRTAADERRGFRRGETSAIIFVLVPMVKHRNAFSIDTIIDASEGEMAQAFLLAVSELGRR